jgi:hypothetical protein
MCIFLDCRFKAKKVSGYLAASMTGDNMATLFETLLTVFMPINGTTITVSTMLVRNRRFLTCAFVQPSSSTPAPSSSTSLDTSTVSVAHSRSSLLPSESDDDNIQDDNVGGARAQNSVERAAAIARVCSFNHLIVCSCIIVHIAYFFAYVCRKLPYTWRARKWAIHWHFGGTIRTCYRIWRRARAFCMH